MSLNVLILEDRREDLEMVVHALQRAGLDISWEQVQDVEAYLAHLSPEIDVILADYSVPQFDAITALDLLKERALDVPLIVVSDTIGEEAAVEALKHGAVDYLLKDRLGRLGEAVRSALRARALRRQNRTAMEALLKSEERYRKLVMESLQGIAIVQEGRTVFCNRAYADIMGYSVDELMTMSAEETRQIVHAQDRARLSTYYRQRMAGKRAPARYTFRVLRKDGAVRWLDAFVTGATYHGKPAAQVYYVDVTERKQAEEAERREQARQRVEAILDAIGEGVLVLDRNGVVEQANPAFVQQTGYSEEAVRGKPYETFLEVVSGLDETVRQKISDTVLEGKPWRGEMTIRRRDGSTFDAALTITSMRDEDDEAYAFVASMRDISRMKEVERMKDSIISIAAHELRTPLTTIGLYIDALNNTDADAARQRRFASAIQRQLAQLQKNIDNMLDLARLEAGRGLEVVPEPLDLQMLVQEVVQPFADTERKHQFRLDGLQPTKPVKGDPLRLAQVLRNLVSNALKYSPQGGPITIYSKNGEDTVFISVEDNGIGIAREQQEHLFEKFYRVANSGRAPRGSGLGLAICRLIVEGHGGRIWAQSEPGVGSTFTFSIPAMETEEAGRRQATLGS